VKERFTIQALKERRSGPLQKLAWHHACVLGKQGVLQSNLGAYKDDTGSCGRIKRGSELVKALRTK